MTIRFHDLRDRNPQVMLATMDVKAAIQRNDANALRQLLREDPTRANGLIEWGQANQEKTCLTHPLHFVCDMVFEGAIARGSEVPLIDALITAGADLNFQRNGKGDTPLIGAASLGAEDAGIRMLDAGARTDRLGLFGETALHWAAMFGEDRLVAKFLECSNRDAAMLNLKDEKYQSTALGWAMHGRDNPGNPADHRRQNQVIALLTAAGSTN